MGVPGNGMLAPPVQVCPGCAGGTQLAPEAFDSIASLCSLAALVHSQKGEGMQGCSPSPTRVGMVLAAAHRDLGG